MRPIFRIAAVTPAMIRSAIASARMQSWHFAGGGSRKTDRAPIISPIGFSQTEHDCHHRSHSSLEHSPAYGALLLLIVPSSVLSSAIRFTPDARDPFYR